MQVNDFIGALPNFIPPKNFKIVRYYDLYSKRSKINLRDLIDQLVKWYGNMSLYNYCLVNNSRGNKIKPQIYPFCGNKIKLVEKYCHIDYV